MDKLKAIILSKPRWIVLLIFSYILILGILKWRMTPDITTVYYLVGGLFGVYFMDGADLIFTLRPSPFRSIIFTLLFGVVSFFIVTSSGNMFGIGLVLSLYVTLLFSAAEEWQMSKNLNTWYTLIQSPPSLRIQQCIMVGCILLLIVETLIFIR